MKKILFLYPIIISLLILISLETIYPKCAHSYESILFLIDTALESVVSIKAKNAIVGQKPAIAKTPDGQLVVLKKFRAATYDRNGAGVIIDSNGLIVTNAHTVQNSGRILVALKNKKVFEAQILGIYPEDDVAFLKIPGAKDLPALDFSEKDPIELNSKIFTIGNSELLHGTISQGTVSGLCTHTGAEAINRDTVRFIQTDFNVYKGDSGGPVFDNEGRLMGMMLANQQESPYRSFAIPWYTIKLRYLELMKTIQEKKQSLVRGLGHGPRSPSYVACRMSLRAMFDSLKVKKLKGSRTL